MLRKIKRIGLTSLIIATGLALILVLLIFLSINRFPEATLKYIDEYLLTSFDINYEKIKRTGSALTPKLSFTKISILNNLNKRIFKAEEITFSTKILSSIISFSPHLNEITLRTGDQKFFSGELNFSKEKLNFSNLNYEFLSNSISLDTGAIHFKQDQLLINAVTGNFNDISGRDFRVSVDIGSGKIHFSSQHTPNKKELNIISELINFDMRGLSIAPSMSILESGVYNFRSKDFEHLIEVSNIKGSSFVLLDHSLRLINASLTIKDLQNLEGIIFFNFDDQKNVKANLLGYELRQTPNIQLRTSIDLDPKRFYSDQDFLQIDGVTKTDLNIIFLNESITAFAKTSFMGTSFNSPFTFIRKSSDERLDTDIIYENKTRSLKVTNNKFDVYLPNLTQNSALIHLGKAKTKLIKNLGPNQYHLVAELDSFNTDELFDFLSSQKFSTNQTKLNVDFDIQELTFFNQKYLNQKGRVNVQNGLFNLQLTGEKIFGKVFNDSTSFIKAEINGLDFLYDFNALSSESGLMNDLNLRIMLSNSTINNIFFEELSAYIQKSGTKLGINNIQLSSSIIKTYSEKPETNYFYYDSKDDFYRLKGKYIIEDLNFNPLNFKDDFSLGYADLNLNFQFKNIKNLNSLEGEGKLLLKDLRWDSFVPSSAALNLLGIFNLKNIIGKVANLDLSLDEYAQTKIDRLEIYPIAAKNYVRLNETMTIETNSSKMMWKGLIQKDNSGKFDELDLSLDVRLRITENLPWYAGIFVGLPAAAGALFFNEIFQEDLTSASTIQFDVKGPINNPVLERIN
jgi:hypothetical protein